MTEHRIGASASSDSTENLENKNQCIPTSEVGPQVFNAEKEVAKQKVLGRYNKNLVNKIFDDYKYSRKSQQFKDKQLDGDPLSLTPFQISTVLKALASINSSASSMILMSLLTGRNLCKNNDIQFSKEPSPCFEFETHKKTYKIGSEIEDRFSQTSDKLKLKFPARFSSSDFYDNFDENLTQEVSEILKEINQNQHFKININSIANYLTFWMTKEGFDSTDIATINGKSISKVSGVHYYLTTNSELQDKYNKYLNYLEDLQNKDFQRLTHKSDTFIGSQLVPEDEFLSDVLNSMREGIINFKFSDFKSIQDHHNQLTLYTLLILNLSTGHRPVDDSYTKISAFNNYHHTVIICDKKIENTLATRVAILSNTAAKQLSSYLRYLSFYAKEHRILNIDVHNKIVQMINGESSLFQLFYEGQLKTISRKILKIESKKILSAPSNWHRHYMRTKLSQKGLHGELIDMYMGHEGTGGYGLSANSKRSLADFRVIAKAIDDIFENLKIKPTS